MRALFLLAALHALLSAATLDAEYAISYGILPSIGTTTLHFESASGRYLIVSEAKLHGLAALLAHHHMERHTSIGSVDAQGRLVPERYETLRTMDGFRRERFYVFDRRRHTIAFHERIERTVDEKRFDPTSMRTIRSSRQESSVLDRREPYADNDLLTLYFNARKTLENLPAGKTAFIAAAGAGHGIVKVVREQMPKHYLLFLYQDIFRSKEGEMSIETDDAFYIERAVLKDVFLFGDLDVEREWLKQSP